MIREVPQQFYPSLEQVEQIRVGFARVQKWNAPVPMGDGFRLWLVTLEHDVVGALTVQSSYPTAAGIFAEIGINFWAGPRQERIRALVEWGQILAQDYFGLGCRVHPRNRAIKKVMAQFGFTHQGHDPNFDNEIWSLLTAEAQWPVILEPWHKLFLSQSQESAQVPNSSAT